VYEGYTDAALTLATSGEELNEEVYTDLAGIAKAIDARVEVPRQNPDRAPVKLGTYASEKGLRIKGQIFAMMTQYAHPEAMGYGEDHED
jgi:hypothetical protein